MPLILVADIETVVHIDTELAANDYLQANPYS
ncbi:MAG: hypothetical protein ACI9SC_002431 [Gammaproteobacteria bacterium]|jgi:hypothetical protein